jgi:hypothetical protein
VYAEDVVPGVCRGGGMNAKTTLRDKIESRINNRQEDVFLSREFYDLGGQDQVLRSLRYLVRDGKLIKIGYGIYCKAKISCLTGKPMIYCPDGFIGASRQALNKLGVQWSPSDAEIAYNEHRSTQIPINNVLKIKGRFSRKLQYKNKELVIEK